MNPSRESPAESPGRDVGSWLLSGAMGLTVLGLVVPAPGVRALTHRAGVASTDTAPDGATGLLVLGLLGLVALALAAVARRRGHPLPALVWGASAWLVTAGVLGVAATAARADRMRTVLAPRLPPGYPRVEVEVIGSYSPVLLVTAGVLAALSTALAAPRRRRVPPRPGPRVGGEELPDGVRVWRMGS